MTLPHPPNILLETTEINSQENQNWAQLDSRKVVFHYPNGEKSEEVHIVHVQRERLDAVVILAHFPTTSGRGVFLRSAVRPPLSYRDFKASKVREALLPGNLWELPAGLVELDEEGVDGLRAAAARELLEEVGFDCKPEDFQFLGKRTFPCPSLVAERLFFLEIEVTPKLKKEPVLDGSPFERHGQVIAVTLDTAMKAIDEGYLIDSKTEIGIRRLIQKYKENHG